MQMFYENILHKNIHRKILNCDFTIFVNFVELNFEVRFPKSDYKFFHYRYFTNSLKATFVSNACDLTFTNLL